MDKKIILGRIIGLFIIFIGLFVLLTGGFSVANQLRAVSIIFVGGLFIFVIETIERKKPKQSYAILATTITFVLILIVLYFSLIQPFFLGYTPAGQDWLNITIKGTVGEELKYGDIAVLTVNKVSKRNSIGFFDADEGHHFLVVDFTLENLQSESTETDNSIVLYSLDTHLEDDVGNKYSRSVHGSLLSKGFSLTFPVSPKDKRNAEIAYQVPIDKNITDLRLIITEIKGIDYHPLYSPNLFEVTLSYF